MGTKQNPSPFDCHAKALPDEPQFTLLARDPDFARLVMKWARKRERDINCGDRPQGDRTAVTEARMLAHAGAVWRRENLGKWRSNAPTVRDAQRAEVDANYEVFRSHLPHLMETHRGQFAAYRHGALHLISSTFKEADIRCSAQYLDGIFSIFEITNE